MLSGLCGAIHGARIATRTSSMMKAAPTCDRVDARARTSVTGAARVACRPLPSVVYLPTTRSRGSSRTLMKSTIALTMTKAATRMSDDGLHRGEVLLGDVLH